MAYIEKEPLCAYLENMGVSAYIIDTIKNEEHFPTADVVEVVRCKGCKWAKQIMIGQCINWICKCPWMFERYVRDGFCNYGERRDT